MENQKTIDRGALRAISYGLYIVSSSRGDRFNGQVANAVMQVTADPMGLAVCLHRDNLTTEFIKSSGHFSVSVLERDTPMTFIGTFGFKCGRDIDKFAACDHRRGSTGAPVVLDHTLAVIEASVKMQMDFHTHIMFLGEVEAASVLREGNPLTYAYYHEVKKGKSPKNAPTFGLNEGRRQTEGSGK